ncbi:MAG: mechanosensitive ion channel [Cyclobacteriaceae bacterium]
MKHLSALVLYVLFLTGMSTITYSQDSLATKNDTTITVSTKVADQVSRVQQIVQNDAPDLDQIFSVSKIFWSIIFLIVGYVVIRVISRALVILAERSAQYRITLKGILPVVRILGWLIIIIIIVAGIFHPPAATILALSASAGVAVGFAAQDILKNIFGGIMILFDRPFQVGDKIEVGSFYGEVTEIGLRSTRIVTPDDSMVSIPNSSIMNGSVSNANSGAAHCQVVAEIYLPLGIDTMRAREIAIQSAQVSKLVFLNKPIAVLFFNEVKERRSYLKMRLKAYVVDIRSEFAFKSEMTEIVVKALIDENLMSEEDFK